MPAPQSYRANATTDLMWVCAEQDCGSNGFKMNTIHEPAHDWEGLEACTYGPSSLHGLKFQQLNHQKSNEQTRPNLASKEASVNLV